MRYRFVIAVLSVLPAGAAMGQDASRYVYTPPLQQPTVHTPGPNTDLVAPIPFGALQNVLNGNALQPRRGGQQPLTPFNTPTQPVVTP